MLPRISTGISDFKTFIEKQCFYIDKTKFIEEISCYLGDSFLFTRPRRFGKTLNMSMLKYFFEIENHEENRNLFNGLYIENSEAMKYFGQYPVIFISLKGVSELSWERCIDKLKDEISSLFRKYTYLESSLNKEDLIKFQNYRLENVTIANLETSLKFLTKILFDYYNKKVIVLIDEYDTPIIASYVNNYYKEAVNFFKTFYGEPLKDNEILELGVVTGIVRVAQAGIFSDLNNLNIYTILKENYDEYFGFTEDEVKYALKTYKLENNLDKVKYWYDGYRFGNTEIYNPWSILSYLKNRNFDLYWSNISENKPIIKLLNSTNKKTFNLLEELLDDKVLKVKLKENVSLVKKLSQSELWEFLLFAGYLTIDKKLSLQRYSIKMVNNEIKTSFKDIFIDMVFKGNDVLEELKSALDNKDLFQIHNSFQNLFLHAISFWDIDTSKEQTYQNILSSFMYGLESDYRVISNKESGFGRADIMLEPVYSGIGYIFELKLNKNKENPLEQINTKKYETELRRRGVNEIVKLGFVFDGKKVEMIK